MEQAPPWNCFISYPLLRRLNCYISLVLLSSSLCEWHPGPQASRAAYPQLQTWSQEKQGRERQKYWLICQQAMGMYEKRMVKEWKLWPGLDVSGLG